MSTHHLAEDQYLAALEGDGKTSDEAKAVIVGAILDFSGGTRQRSTNYAGATTDSLIEEALYCAPGDPFPCGLVGTLKARAALLASDDPRAICIARIADTSPPETSPVFIEALRAVLLPPAE
jgi:hypothetical protein